MADGGNIDDYLIDLLGVYGSTADKGEGTIYGRMGRTAAGYALKVLFA